MPICYRQLHYGLYKDRTEFPEKIYSSRSERLYYSDIKISQSEFINLVL